MQRWRIPSIALSCLLSWPAASGAFVAVGLAAQQLQARDERSEIEYGVKAGYLYHFAKLTTWPAGSFESKTAPLVITVVGTDPFGAILDRAVNGKKVGERELVVRRCESVEDLESTHVVFVGGMSDEARAALLKRCAKKSILVVGERAGLAEQGALLNFYIERSPDGKTTNVRFEVNLEAVATSKLEISSQLLKLARIVRKSEAKGE